MFSFCFIWSEQSPHARAVTKVFIRGRKSTKLLHKFFKIIFLEISLYFLLNIERKLKKLMRRIFASMIKTLKMLIFTITQLGIGRLKGKKKERRN